MKKILSTVFAAFGISAAAHAAPPVQMIDSKSIRFTMPTVAADDIQFVMPTKESFDGAPQFHEDEWCQVEFFPQSQLSEIKNLLSQYKEFEKKNRTPHGWNEIYARRIKRNVVASGGDAANEIAKLIHASKLPPPILTTSSKPLGQVKDGFTLELPGSVALYGLSTSQGVIALGAIVAQGGDDQQLTKAFMSLSKKYQLLMVDWRAQQVLVSVNSDGKISVWRP